MDSLSWMAAKELAEVIKPVADVALVYIAYAVFRLERRVTRIEVGLEWVRDARKAAKKGAWKL